MNGIKYLILAVAFLSTFSTSAQKTNKKDFISLNGGLSYQIAYDSPGEAQPEVGDFVETNMYLIVDNKVIYNSLEDNALKPISFVVTEPTSSTDVQEVITYMTPGDSALIRMSVDSMIKNGSPQLDWMKPQTGQHATYVVKLLTLRRKSTLNK